MRTGHPQEKENPQGPHLALLSSRKQHCGQTPGESWGPELPLVSMSLSTSEEEGECQGSGNKAPVTCTASGHASFTLR